MRSLEITIVAFSVFFARDVRCESSDIPPYLKICHRNDPNLNECVKDSVEYLQPYLKTGIPALNIPPCEPLLVPEFVIEQTSGPVSLSSIYSNVVIRGATNFTLQSINVRPDIDRIHLKLYVPKLKLYSKYGMSGKIIMWPVNAEGIATGEFRDIYILVQIVGNRYRNPETNNVHFHIRDFYVDLTIQQGNVNLQNIFKDVNMSMAMNRFINENWNVVAAELKPPLEDSLSTIFKDFSNKIYAKYPLNTLLPP